MAHLDTKAVLKSEGSDLTVTTYAALRHSYRWWRPAVWTESSERAADGVTREEPETSEQSHTKKTYPIDSQIP